MIINILRWLFIILFIFSYLYFNVNPVINNKYKNEINDYIKYKMIPYIYIEKSNFDIKKLNKFEYPIVLKPSKCEGLSNDVKVAENPLEAKKYLDEIKDNFIIIQKYSKLKNEATILYDRNPLTNEIKIEITSRYLDNIENVKYPIYKFGGINTKQTKYKITKKLRDTIIYMSNKIPDFYFGRYDIKFKNAKELENGNFEVIEVNFVYCADTRFNFAYDSSIIYVIYSYILRLYYGYLNIILGKRLTLYDFTKILIFNIEKMLFCNVCSNGLNFVKNLNNISI